MYTRKSLHLATTLRSPTPLAHTGKLNHTFHGFEWIMVLNPVFLKCSTSAKSSSHIWIYSRQHTLQHSSSFSWSPSTAKALSTTSALSFPTFRRILNGHTFGWTLFLMLNTKDYILKYILSFQWKSMVSKTTPTGGLGPVDFHCMNITKRSARQTQGWVTTILILGKTWLKCNCLFQSYISVAQ